MRYNIDYVGLAGPHLLVIGGWAILRADRRAHFCVKRGEDMLQSAAQCMWYNRADLDESSANLGFGYRGLGFCALLFWDDGLPGNVSLCLYEGDNDVLFQHPVALADASKFSTFFFGCAQRVRLHLAGSLSKIPDNQLHAEFLGYARAAVERWCLEIDACSGSLMPHMPVSTVEGSFTGNGVAFLCVKGSLDAPSNDLKVNIAACNAKVAAHSTVMSGRIDPQVLLLAAEGVESSNEYTFLFIAEILPDPIRSEPLTLILEVVADGKPYYTRFELLQREENHLARILTAEIAVLAVNAQNQLADLNNFLATYQQSRLSQVVSGNPCLEEQILSAKKLVVLMTSVENPSWLNGMLRMNVCQIGGHASKIIVYDKSLRSRAAADYECLLTNSQTSVSSAKRMRDVGAQIPADCDGCLILPSTTLLEPALFRQIIEEDEAGRLGDWQMVEICRTGKLLPIAGTSSDEHKNDLSPKGGIINPILVAPNVARALLLSCLDYRDLDLNILNFAILSQGLWDRGRLGSPYLRNYNRFNLESARRDSESRALAAFISGK